MRFRVLKPFINIDGAFLKLNDSVECTENRVRILRNNGIIGGVMEQGTMPLPSIPEIIKEEKAIDITPKKRRGRKKKNELL